MTSSSTVGAIGENLVINDLLRLGCRVYKEVTAGNDVDLVAHNGTRFFRVQVKSVAETKRGVLPVSIEKRWRDKTGAWTRSRYTTESVDVIAAVAVDRGIVAYIPLADFGEQVVMCIRFEAPRNGQKKGVRVLADFSPDRIISV